MQVKMGYAEDPGVSGRQGLAAARREKLGGRGGRGKPSPIINIIKGLEQGVGHPQSPVSSGSRPKGLNHNVLEKSGPYSKEPKVADTMIKADWGLLRMKFFSANAASCQPVYFFPDKRLAFTRCEVLPGVTLRQLKGHLKSMIASAKEMPGEKGGYTHAVCVEHGKYAEHIAARLTDQGKEFPEHFFVETHSITKHVVLSMVLIARTRFRIGAEYQFKIKDYRLRGYAPGPLQFQESSRSMFSALGQSEKEQVRRKDLLPIVIALKPYFQSGLWWHDRLGAALSSFWSALCTPFPDQAFLSLTTSLEAILSTQALEITHTLAERAAALVAKDFDRRLEIYRLAKKLYKTRSKIVHGAAFLKKGRLHSESLFITAKHTSVPMTELKELVGLTISVIRAALLNDDYCSTIRSARNEDTINKRVDDFFLCQLFRPR
jgi:hypothetical protein